ncbi:MAG: winged helix-turn-helix transcriptional regulator [Flavobacteriales bacterium]|nr:winged helix-turn-helix transcriptional regulator [Flavobacteriales bacterium]
MNNYEKIANGIVVNRIRSSWIEIFKFYNEQNSKEIGTLSTAFVLMTINEKFGTQVTKIAPRMGMEPNSLSRLLKSLEEKELVFKRKDNKDKRKVYICLTENGLKLRNIAAERLFSLEKNIKDKISPTDLSSFYKVTDAISEIIEIEKTKIALK